MNLAPRQLTCFKLLLFFILGIIIGDYYEKYLYELIISAVISSLIFALIAVIKTLYRPLILSYSIYAAILIIGAIWFNTYQYHQAKQIVNYDNISNKKVKAIMVPTDFPKTNNKVRFRAKLIGIENEALSIPIQVEAYIDSSEYNDINPLDTVYAVLTLNRTASPSNNYAFDYSKFLRLDKIYYQAWVSDIIIVKPIKEYLGIDRITIDLRNKALIILKEKLSGDRYSIASALLLGHRNSINKDLQKQFANSGAIHVLAVSGLHVGIVIGVISLLFFWVPKSHDGLINFRNIFILVVVIFYALITGLAAPVVRSSLIFGLLLTGRLFQKKAYSLNLLAGAAFIMLLVNPYQLFMLSFQLSFMAVSSIIVFYPIISKWYRPRSFIDKYIWTLTAMSISAQVFILPLSLFYFHQFPVYFILSSIAAISIATVMIPVGGLVIILAFFNIDIQYLDLLLNWLSQSMYDVTFYFDQIPFTVIKSIWFSPIHLVLLSMGILSFAIYAYVKRFNWILMSLTCMLSLSLLCCYNLISQKHQVALSNYERDEGITDIIIGQKAYEITNKSLSAQKLLFVTRDYRHANGVQEVEKIAVGEFLSRYNIE